jgi:DNA-binding MarR family transcriptional regulator
MCNHGAVSGTEAYEQLNLGLLLFIPYRFMESAVLEALRAHGHDLGLSQARVFQRIAPEGSRLSDLARASQLSKQTVGSIVDQLQRAGYVERAPDPQDARARLVRITAKGREIVALSEPAVREVEAAWQTHLGPVRTRQLRAALVELREFTDPFNLDRHSNP